MTAKNKPYHERVAEEVIKALQEGTAPWIKPWVPGQVPDTPINAVTGKPYRGWNRVFLSMVGYSDPRWCTYKQAQQLGAQVKKGSTGTAVQYWKFEEERLIKDDQNKPILKDGKKQYETVQLDKPSVFYATVFHASQIEGLPPLPPRAPKPEWERHEESEKILKQSGAQIFHDQNNRAFYRPSSDDIHLPDRGQFESADSYYATALHELGHWTGHPSRLNRDIQNPFGSEKYAREELRAELASYMIGTDLGIGHDPGQHHSYIDSWISVLKRDPMEIIRASRDAERIKDYLMAREQIHSQQEVTTGKLDIPAPTANHSLAALPQKTIETKIYLAVPYKEKDLAKANGAKWDGKAKSWYAPEGSDVSKFERWLKVGGQQKAIPEFQFPQQEFGQTLRDAGLIIEGYPLMDGKIHRVPVENGRPGTKDGAYCGFEDGKPNGWWQNHKNGQQGKWLATGHALTEEAKADLNKETEEVLKKAADERNVTQEKAQRRAYAKWMNAGPATTEHVYLEKKGVNGDALKRDGQGNLLVPGFDLETGRLQTIQYISPTGGKWFEKDCPKKGAVCLLEADKEQGAAKDVVLVAEGYATGASLRQATGLPVAVAFDAGNLKEAALAIRKKLPKAKIIICADNDHNHPSGTNVGIEKAKEASAQVGGQVLIPSLTKAEKEKNLTDFNDLHKHRGLKAVQDQVKQEKGLER